MQRFPEVLQTFRWYIGLSLMRIAWYRRMRNCWTVRPQGSSSINPITRSDKPFLPLYVKWVFGAATFSVSRQYHLLPPVLLTSQTFQSILVFFPFNSSGILHASNSKNKPLFFHAMEYLTIFVDLIGESVEFRKAAFRSALQLFWCCNIGEMKNTYFLRQRF